MLSNVQSVGKASQSQPKFEFMMTMTAAIVVAVALVMMTMMTMMIMMMMIMMIMMMMMIEMIIMMLSRCEPLYNQSIFSCEYLA